jgi:hypothetical protein
MVTFEAMSPKKLVITSIIYLLTCMLLVSCQNTQKGLKQRVLELCGHIPDPECLQQSEGFLTEDYYAVLEEMINLPEITPVLHQWEFWFVASDGSPVSRDQCEVLSVERTDRTHATAVISVQPEDTDYFTEEHTLYLQKEKGKWKLADFDDTKQASYRYIEIYNTELAPSE